MIPPAWKDVWICGSAEGHLQATGRDQRGRKQYRYHAVYRQARDQTKFGRMPEFARALPHIRRRVTAAKKKIVEAVKTVAQIGESTGDVQGVLHSSGGS